MLTCSYNQIELKEIIKEAITKICEDNEIESTISTELAQEIQNIHIIQQIPIGIITNNLTNLGPLKKNLLPNIYHRITKKIHKHIWKPSRTHIQQQITSLPNIINTNSDYISLTSIDRQYTLWLNKFIQHNQTSPLIEYID